MDPEKFSYAHLGNLSFLENLYASYQKNPESVDPSWRYFFEGMEFSKESSSFQQGSEDLRIYKLINAYRTYGHLMAQCDPLQLTSYPEPPELDLKALGFSSEEKDKNFPTCGFLKEDTASLQEIISVLQMTYCGSIGIEYRGIVEPKIEKWLQGRIEPRFGGELSVEEKKEALHRLNKAELFESFLHTKYVGQKRFSLEGGETLIPLLAAILDHGAFLGVTDAVIGMAHRGRLNVLANILNKSYLHIFHEFEGFYTPDLLEGTGDVKYHKGFTGTLKAKNREISVVLSANPSHLESVDPVVEGHVRAKQELKGSKEKRKEVVPILIHGDAALAGQGVVYETLQMCRLNGYTTGGTVHIVINNQIGFTTLPKDSRSTRYCTDIAKAFGAPVFHVNGEDADACIKVAKLAIALRQTFGCDVFIDLLCYRKYGHNEGDEPMFTQPREYQVIKNKKPIRLLYEDQLVKEGVLSRDEAQVIEEKFKKDLQEALDKVKTFPPEPKEQARESIDLFNPVATALNLEALIQLAETFSRIPEGFSVHPKIQRLLKERLEMVKADPTQAAIDWGMGEHLAFASLLAQGIHVRISGQDSRRGTFSHRHAVWVDQKTHERYFPLSHLGKNAGLFDVYNSHLSEMAVLAFEFGYALSYPQSFVIWEAQYGDFANGAQIIIDQYLSAAEQKWGLSSNLTVMLPHGYEGQGPEHSSGRIERFLQLCGDDNIQVANCTTPAQLFHLLRRQALRPLRKPLVLFTPKALLRHPETISSLQEFSQGGFQEILEDPHPSENPKKLLFCSGKVYYDLIAERKQRQSSAIAIVRIEQLYPLDEKRLSEVVALYPGVEKFVWVQEEHSNMGAWEYIKPYLLRACGRVRYAGRGRAASPAAGSHALHKKQFAAMIDQVFKE